MKNAVQVNKESPQRKFTGYIKGNLHELKGRQNIKTWKLQVINEHFYIYCQRA